jgi:hypothetical protein
MSTLPRFTREEIPTEEIDRIEAAHQPLVDAARELVDAIIRTTVADEDLAAATESIRAATDLLRARQLDGPAGVHFNNAGRSWNWGNAVVGQRNAVAPPLIVRHCDDLVRGEAYLAAAYEGPPGLVHGGVTALLLDHFMGETASARRRLTMTGTLTIRYQKGIRLGPVTLEGEIVREEGRKVFVSARVADTDGISVVADGVFIRPSWAASTPGRINHWDVPEPAEEPAR